MTLHATRGGAGLGACSRRCCASGAALEAAELASQIRATDDDEAWPLDLLRTYLCSTIGLPLAVVAAQPSTRCGCARWYLDAYGDHVSTCKNHTGAAKAYDWACEWLAAWFRSTGTKVKTQRAVTAINRDKQGGLKLADNISQGAQDLVLDLSFWHYRAEAAPRNWHRGGELLHHGNPDQDLQRTRKRHARLPSTGSCIGTIAVISTSCRPSPALPAAFIASCCACCFCMRPGDDTLL